MDRAVGTASPAQMCFLFVKKTLQFLFLASSFCFLYSYYSGFPFFSYNLQLSTLIFPLFAHALDRKYMFIICNGILVFLAKNMRFSSHSSNYIKSAGDGVEQINELPPILKEVTVEENVASMEYVVSPPDMAAAEEEQAVEQRGQDYGGLDKGDEEMKTEGIIHLQSEEWDEDDDDDELEENTTVEDTTPTQTEEVNDACVSTEELNQKFEEFIRKMKEEIRIEAQQQLITV